MTTCSKNNICRPKQLRTLTTLHPTLDLIEPTTIIQALKLPHWRRAMDDESNALILNNT